MQLTRVGKELFKGARQAQQLEAAGSDDPKVFARLRKIKLVNDPLRDSLELVHQVETLREAKKDWKEIQELVGISRSTYYDWKKTLKTEGVKGLKPKPRKPKRLRQKVHWTPELLVRIEALRKEGPTWEDGPSGSPW